jgi:hypothetical protein
VHMLNVIAGIRFGTMLQVRAIERRPGTC